MLRVRQILEFNENQDLHISSFTIANDDTYKATLKMKVPTLNFKKFTNKSRSINPFDVLQKQFGRYLHLYHK